MKESKSPVARLFTRYYHDRSKLSWEEGLVRPRCVSCREPIVDGSFVHVRHDGLEHQLCLMERTMFRPAAERSVRARRRIRRRAAPALETL